MIIRGNLAHFWCLAPVGWWSLISSVRIQLGNNRNDHFKYFLGVCVRLIKVWFQVSKGNKFWTFGYCPLNRGCLLNTGFTVSPNCRGIQANAWNINEKNNSSAARNPEVKQFYIIAVNDDEFRWKLASDSLHLVPLWTACILLHSNRCYESELTGVGGHRNWILEMLSCDTTHFSKLRWNLNEFTKCK